jgi:hypothetical protein
MLKHFQFHILLIAKFGLNVGPNPPPKEVFKELTVFMEELAKNCWLSKGRFF